MAEYVAVVEVYSQCSGDYASVKSVATKIFGPFNTVAEVMTWASQFRKQLGMGDVILTEAMQDQSHD